MKCTKCGYEQDDNAHECAKCGVIFSKLEDVEIRKDIFANAPETPEFTYRAKGSTYKKNTIILIVLTIIAAIFTMAVVYLIFGKALSMYVGKLDHIINIK